MIVNPLDESVVEAIFRSYGAQSPPGRLARSHEWLRSENERLQKIISAFAERLAGPGVANGTYEH